MSLEVIWDATARQAALVSGIKAAYATRTGGQGATVKLYPDDIPDGPVAIVDYAGSEMLQTGAYELVRHTFDIALWMPLGNGSRGNAVAVLAPMFELFVVAFRANAGLFGTAHHAEIVGSSGFEDDGLPGIPDKSYLVQSLAFTALEARNVSAGIGPSS